MNILYIIAMQAEAQPFIEHYGVEEVKDFFAPLPCKLYTSEDEIYKLTESVFSVAKFHPCSRHFWA